jgi:ATP-binding cassette subfamily B protein
VLRDVSVAIPRGTRVGIAGPTGAGKTTLISLLLRFFDPNEGAVRLDGIDLRDYALADLRNQYALVLQESVLFSTTVAENIAYGRLDASREEIAEAARAAHAHEFIRALPQGYDTRVGERGMMLSGGERQRIALARAFLRDAPILVLDEPTSAIDLASEKVILEALDALMRGRTAFIIAHRLHTLAGCDVQLELAGGRVVAAEGLRRASNA